MGTHPSDIVIRVSGTQSDGLHQWRCHACDLGRCQGTLVARPLRQDSTGAGSGATSWEAPGDSGALKEPERRGEKNRVS